MRGTKVAVVRGVVGLLALVNLETGLWATFAPAGFYRTYPGFGHHWISVQGPYNEHLVTDAGEGFLAVGVALLIAAAWVNRAALTVALAAVVVHALPHFLFHVTHPVPGFSAFDQVAGVWSLGLEGLVAVVLLLAVWTSKPWASPAPAG
jgi:hypothetical protein